MPTLRIKSPAQGEITHELRAERVSIGRWPDNTIQISDRSVSAHHAELLLEDGHYRLHDLGSTNLSFVDGAAATDYHLHQPCQLVFGTVACEFDPYGGVDEARLPVAQLEKDLGFLRGDNAELRGQIVALQRQIDILSSARLVTKKADMTPFAAHNDSLKAVVSERDDLRHMSSGLKFELENLREELAATASERDAARQACELLQVEKAAGRRELQELRKQLERGAAGNHPTFATAPATPAPAAPVVAVSPVRATSPTSVMAHPTMTMAAFSDSAAAADAGTTQRICLLLAAPFQAIAEALEPVRSSLATLAGDPAETALLAELLTYVGRLVTATGPLGPQPLSRLAAAIEALLYDFATSAQPPEPNHVRTLIQAADLISQLLDPRHTSRTQSSAPPKVLAVDDDADLLQLLTVSLELAQLSTASCTDALGVQNLIESTDYDLLLLDVNMPGLDGPALCSRIRENARYRKTPILFLTGTNTLHHRAQASLSGGNDYLPKPFNTAELALKVETWIWKHRFGLI